MSPEQKTKPPPPVVGKEAEVEVEVETPKQEESGRFAFLSRIPSGPRITLVLCLLVVGQGAPLAYFYTQAKKNQPVPIPEVTLGEFQFNSRFATPNQVNRASFSLHIALLDQLDRQARDRLSQRRFRVLQNVEELLRKTPSGDFDDPTLVDLKRQLQERINQTLEMRVIAEVVITGLEVEREPAAERQADDSVESIAQATAP